VHVIEDQNLGGLGFQLRKGARQALEEFFLSWRTFSCRSIPNGFLVTLCRVPSFRAKDIESSVHGGTIKVASRVRPQLGWKLFAAQTKKERLNDVFRIREISGHSIRRPMNEVVVIEE
jgi:hypothetical protein